MQSRYLGSDSLSQRQLQVQQEAAQANALAVERIAKASDSTVQGLVEGQRQIGQMQVAYATAQAQAANNGALSGLTQLVQAGTEAYINYDRNEQRKQQLKLQQEQEAKAAADKLAKEQAKEASEREFVVAADDVSNLTASYVRDQWNQGTLNYRTQAAKTLARYRNLTPEQQAQLVDRINNSALARDEEIRKGLEEQSTKLQNQKADSERIALALALQPDISLLKKLPPTEQARPYLEQLNTKLDSFMAQNSGLSYDQKLAAVNAVSQDILKAFEGKADVYADFVAGMRARAEWATGYQKLYGTYLQNRDLSAFKDGILQLKIATGKDYSQYMVAPGESEAENLKVAQTMQGIEDLRQKRAESTGATFQYSTEDVRLIAAGAIISPGFQQTLENNPLFAKNPGIKSGFELAKRLQAARTEQAELGVSNAQTQTELAKLDLTNINNFSSVTRSIILRQQQGQTLTPEQQLYTAMLERANAQSGGALSGVIATLEQAGTRQLTKEEVASIQQTLNNSAAGIRNAQQAVVGEQKAKIRAFNEKYSDIIRTFGTIPDDTTLVNYWKAGQQTLQQKFNQLKQDAEANSAVVAPAYGANGNFNQANQGVAAFGSPDGKVRIAPRTSVMVQTQNADGGAPWITPVQAGLGIRHSFNKGMGGGGYGAGRDRGARKHAGIDFGLAQGQNAMSVVSGTVARVGTAKGYGNYLDIVGDNGFVYRYTHVRSLVQQGSRVQAGQAVASPNMSGTNIGGAHLHFEVLPGQGYKPGSTYGFDKTIDPVAHLRSLTPNAGQVLQAPGLRGQSVASVSRQMPWAKTTAPTIFTRGGGALQANLFQQVGRPTLNSSKVFNSQRPLTKGILSAYTGGAPVRNNPTDDHGYAWIRQRPEFAARLAQVADALGVPGQWIADIMRQETGENFALAQGFHGNSRGENANRNYGLFGFGSDSGVPNYTRLSPVQQLDAYYNYMRQNGWLKHLARTGGNVSIGQLWAMTKMGTKWRNDILNGRDPATMVDRTGKSQLEQFQMLGKWVGRQYDFGRGSQSSRSQRNRAPGRRASSIVEQALAANNSPDVVYRTTTI